VEMWRSANLCKEPPGRSPICQQNHRLSIVFCSQGVREILSEQSQLLSHKPQCSFDLIVHHTFHLLSLNYLVWLLCKSFCTVRNNHTQHDEVRSAMSASTEGNVYHHFDQDGSGSIQGVRNLCYRDKVNKLPLRAKRLHLAHQCNLLGDNPSHSLSKPVIATIYRNNVELASSCGPHILNKFGGYMHRRDVNNALWVLDQDMAQHGSHLHGCA